MKLDPFITFQNQGEYFILQTKDPNYIGKFIRFNSDQELAFYDHEKHLHTAQVPGYRILIVFAGSLHGNHILLRDQWQKDLATIFYAMAGFYLQNRIFPNVKKYKNFLIH